VTLGTLLFTWRSFNLPVTSIATTQKDTTILSQKLEYETRVLSDSIVNILKVPANSQYLVTPPVSPQLNTVGEFAQKHNAITALNAGYFDQVNQKSTSYITIQRKLATFKGFWLT
jgi:exopolysaccharide biosynthesis protein